MHKPITFKTEVATYHLAHLNDMLYTLLWEQSVAIQDESYWNLFLLTRSLERQGEQPLHFGQIYVALKHLCGHESSAVRDTWKSGFLFPFLLTGTWNQQGLLYLLRIANYRSSLEMSLRRLMAVDHASSDRHVVRQPLENELPQDAITELCMRIYGFLEGYVSTIPHSTIDPFYRRVDSNLILFGYRDGAFFEQDYDDPDAYAAAVYALQQDVS
jgi:hypothetical protein